MKIIKPKALGKGDVIGICAPAGPLKSYAALTKAIRYLETMGYRVKLAKNIFSRYGYLAGTDQHRAEDFNNLVSDKKVKAIIFLRGGYGSSRMLPLVDFELVKKNPKIIVGFSDATVLQLAILKKTGLSTFSGPMVESTLSKNFSGAAEELFWELLSTRRAMGIIPEVFFAGTEIITHGTATGRLLGGNLSVFSSMIGTQYFSSFKNNILFLEDIGEIPYRVDRMLQQLKNAKLLEKVSGILLGDFSTCTPEKNKSSLTLHEIFKQSFPKYPTLSNLRFGHIRNPLTLPYGLRVNFDSKKNALYYLESAVI